MTDDAADLRRIAERLAREAGGIALDGRRRSGIGSRVGHETKSSDTDPVTEFDRAAEEHLVTELRALRPDDSIVGEEGAAHDGTSEVSWHLDPVDGTVNFVYDLPAWCTSVGAVDRDGGVAGAVYAPVLDELYSACRGGGATLNGAPIEVSSTTALERALVATGFSYRPERRAEQADRLAGLMREIRDVRRAGSAALDLCTVACGRVDAYFEDHLNSWDVVAGLLIATEAGAVASDLLGGPVRSTEVAVASPGLHGALIAALGRSVAAP